VKLSRLIPVAVIPLLFSCLPKQPEIPMTEVPAGPLVQALEQRRQSFSTLKALASVLAVRKDRKRSFESVGILLKGREELRIEAYGPLGETLITLLWTGKDVLLDLQGKRRVLEPKGPGLERLLGVDMGPAELCAVLSGNVPGVAAASRAALLCAPDNRCVLELRGEDTLVRVPLDGGRAPEDGSVPSYEVYRGKKMIYRASFGSFERVSGYLLPKRIVVENPGKRASLTVEYADVDVNVPLDEGAFAPTSAEGRP
jgi:hypothetical protein